MEITLLSKEIKMDTSKYEYMAEKGLSEKVIREISSLKKEPRWMLSLRLEAYDYFKKLPLPNLRDFRFKIDFDQMIYYARFGERAVKKWEDLPKDIREIYEKLGIKEAEAKYLAGLTLEYDSEPIYENIRKDLERKGILFMDLTTAIKRVPELVSKYLGKLVSFNLNKFAALNLAVWSGGSFLYVPKNTKVSIPLQTFFWLNRSDVGHFKRNLFILDEGAEANFIEGCTAPTFSEEALHSAVIEGFLMRNSKLKFVTIQNWSRNVHLVDNTRFSLDDEAKLELIDGNLGSGFLYKHPTIFLKGSFSTSEVMNLGYAKKGQYMDSGTIVVHEAPNTQSRVISKSVSQGGGVSIYRGLVKIFPNASDSRVAVQCDSLILDEDSRADTYPEMEVEGQDILVSHEAKVGRIGTDQIFYLMSRGFTEAEAMTLVITGFLEEFVKSLPFEYAIELNRLIEMEMKNAVG